MNLSVLKLTHLLIYLLLGSLSSLAFSASSLSVSENGVLLGANNVSVHGNLFDVRFYDGSIDFYAPNSVNFDSSTAEAASQALLDNVFIDDEKGLFDSSPGLTNGCTRGSTTCRIFTPLLPGVVTGISTSGKPRMAVWYVLNTQPSLGANGYRDNDFLSAAEVPLNFNTRIGVGTWAIWSPAISVVPEPKTYLLLFAGLIIVGLGYRKNNNAI